MSLDHNSDQAFTVVVTGANRGIGLSFCKHYQAQGAKVYALCRSASAELTALDVELIEGVDVADMASVQKAAEQISAERVDLLINNAGILRDEQLPELNFASIEAQFQTNTLGPLRVVECLLTKLGAGSKIANITSRMGSIADNTSGGRYGYRMSKCALNIASVSLAQDLQPKGIAVAILHPGLVGTDMIGGVGNVTPDQAVAGLVARIDELTLETSGTFWHAEGMALPW